MAVLHDLNHADHIIAMRDGRIVATGTPEQVVTVSASRRSTTCPTWWSPIPSPAARWWCRAADPSTRTALFTPRIPSTCSRLFTRRRRQLHDDDELRAHQLVEYSGFPVTVTQSRQLGPGFGRITLTGDRLRRFATWGLDQRIKLVLPMTDGSRPDFGLLADPTPHPSRWYARWKELPEDRRNALRTYTPAAIRPEVGEIDVDVFLHEPAGPASTWAASCASEDELVLTGPDARAGYTGYGIPPPGPPSRLLLVGDASSLPAIRNILAALDSDTLAEVFLDLAYPADNTLEAPASGNRIREVEPDAATAGGFADDGSGDSADDSADDSTADSALERAVREWGVSNGADLATDPAAYAWIAGEPGATTRLRRHLTTDLTMPKDRVAFLGYWKLGGPLVG